MWTGALLFLAVVVVQAVIVWSWRKWREHITTCLLRRGAPLLQRIDSIGETDSSRQWAQTYQRIMASTAEELDHEVSLIVARTGHPKQMGPEWQQVVESALKGIADRSRQQLIRIYRRFEYLAVANQYKFLDRTRVKVFEHDEHRYLIIGEAIDEQVFYAVRIDRASTSVYEVVQDTSGRTIEIAEAAPSVAHFICLDWAVNEDSERMTRERRRSGT